MGRFRRLRLRLRHGGKNLKSRNGKLYVDGAPYSDLDMVATVHDKPFLMQKQNRGAPSWADYTSGSLADRLRVALGWRTKREQMHQRKNRKTSLITEI